MKGRAICWMLALVLLMLPLSGSAEGGLIGALETLTPPPTVGPTPEPTPEPTPAPVEFEGEGLKLTLPAGFELVEGDAREGYDAALAADYPGATRVILAATDAEREAAVVVVSIDGEADCVEAAREAADALIGDAEAAKEETFGENRCASFACAIGERAYRLYYVEDAGRLLVVGASGLEAEEIDPMLTSLQL